MRDLTWRWTARRWKRNLSLCSAAARTTLFFRISNYPDSMDSPHCDGVWKFAPRVPFICVSGTIGEETAVELLKQGAVDYVLKDRLARLPSAIHRALEEAKEKEARRQAEAALKESKERYNALFERSLDLVYVCDFEG